MKALHVITGISRSSGGPSRSSQGLVAAQCRVGIDAWIYSFDGLEPWIDGVRRFKPSGNELSASDLTIFDLIHIHGIWDPKLHKVAVMSRAAKVPYVIAPRGMLEQWSLKQKWLKKRIARFLYQDKDLRLAAALHATAESEADQFRRLGFKNPVIISPNGVNVPSGSLEFRVESLELEKNEKRALFVSRMHPKKGVLELVEAWGKIVVSRQSLGVSGNDNSELQTLNSKLNQWTCELVYTVNGDFEKAYEAKVKSRILELGMSYRDVDGSIHPPTSNSSSPPNFIFTGPLDDDAKWEAYRRADFFVLPTYSENFGIVVAEALWACVPVITTEGTPWSELNSEKCGWWIGLPSKDSNASAWGALDDSLISAMTLSDAERAEMGVRGKKLVEEKYTWNAVCMAMIEGYKEVLNARVGFEEL